MDGAEFAGFGIPFACVLLLLHSGFSPVIRELHADHHRFFHRKKQGHLSDLRRACGASQCLGPRVSRVFDLDWMNMPDSNELIRRIDAHLAGRKPHLARHSDADELLRECRDEMRRLLPKRPTEEMAELVDRAMVTGGVMGAIVLVIFLVLLESCVPIGKRSDIEASESKTSELRNFRISLPEESQGWHYLSHEF
jgi:hypothetical protein